MDTLQARGALDRDLSQIQQELLRLGSMVEQAIERSIQALKERDAALAQQIINDDKKINDLRYTIEEDCVTAIATQQPFAGDLRAIIAAIHIAGELERMADHAEGIATLTLRMVDQPLLKPLIDVPRMGNTCQEMIRASLDAYVKRDIELAKQVVKRDDEIDGLYDQVLRELLTYMLEDPKNISRATFLLWVTHNLERIGDRATNVCERVIFMATGELRELHSSDLS